ncbi:MAG TPA: metal ABC transporter permease [bacterium]|nr:metal ABC transporter permease [bacterium]
MLSEMIHLPFFQRALVGGLLVVIMLSLLSFFVVLRKISFAGAGISHSALGGVAIGLALGANTTLTATLFTAAVALVIGFISRGGHLAEDAAIGITLSGTMALGIVLIALSGGYVSSLFSFLFGSILAITPNDIRVIAVYCASIVTLVLVFFKPLVCASFDEELARTSGVPVAFLNYLLLVLISLAIVASMKLVGIILVSALLVLPAATAYQLAQTYRKIIMLALASGVLSLLTGLVVSYRFNVPSGATIVLCACGIFALGFIFSPKRRRRARTHGG